MFLIDFLKLTRNLLKNRTSGSMTCIVLGNESCDLDSAVSAITLAYLHKWHLNAAHDYVPVLNIPRSDYVLKTEVRHMFSKCGIMEQHLIFRDELSPELLAASRFMLVDHHVSPYAARVDIVFDHRPYDEDAAHLPSGCTTRIERVGSCATLIAEQYLSTDPPLEIEKAQLPYVMLRNTILLDTDNLSETSKLASETDRRVVACLEERLAGIEIAERAAIFGELVAARADISNFTAAQMLRKDCKVLTSPDDRFKVALPGFRMLVQQFIERPDAVAATLDFAKQGNYALVVLVGNHRNESDGRTQRDIGLVGIAGDVSLFERVQAALLTANSPSLQLVAFQPDTDAVVQLGECRAFFQQLNNSATRKNVLPVVKRAFDEWVATV